MTEPPPRLLCGADADELLEQVTERPGEPLTSHQRGCVHCQAALSEFERLWAPMNEAATEPVRAPRALLESVLDQLRATLQAPEWGVLVQERGLTRIAVDVVLAVVWETTETVPGVRAALPSVTVDEAATTVTTATGDGPQAGAVAVGLTGRSVAVAVTVAAEYGVDLRALGNSLARAITSDIERLLGLRVGSVMVHIDDVLAAR